MAKTYNRLHIEIGKPINSIGIRPVKGDTNSRYLDVSLYDNNVPINLTGHQVRINFLKLNGLSYFNEGEITDAEAGRCQFALTNDILSEAKAIEAQISIWNKEGDILSTEKFTIMVSDSIRDDEAIQGTNEFGVFVVMFQYIYEAYDLMTTMVQNIGNPSNIAEQYNLATMWQAWEFLTDYMKTDLTNMIERAIANASVQGVLDVLNNTTAKEESVSNVLKKISDETNANIENFVTGVYTTAGNVTNKTILEVNGRGELLTAFAKGVTTSSKNLSLTLEITIDDAVYTAKVVYQSGTGDAQNGIVKLARLDSLCYLDNDNSYGVYFDKIENSKYSVRKLSYNNLLIVCNANVTEITNSYYQLYGIPDFGNFKFNRYCKVAVSISNTHSSTETNNYAIVKLLS